MLLGCYIILENVLLLLRSALLSWNRMIIIAVLYKTELQGYWSMGSYNQCKGFEWPCLSLADLLVRLQRIKEILVFYWFRIVIDYYLIIDHQIYFCKSNDPKLRLLVWVALAANVLACNDLSQNQIHFMWERDYCVHEYYC